MWKVNINALKELAHNPSSPVEWELVNAQGSRCPGKISHHKVFVVNNTNVLMYGGQKGEDSNSEIFIFNPTTANWSTLQFSVSDNPISYN